MTASTGGWSVAMLYSVTHNFTLSLSTSRNLFKLGPYYCQSSVHSFLKKEHKTIKSVWVAKKDTFLTSTVHTVDLSLTCF